MASDPMAQDIIRCELCGETKNQGKSPAEVVCKTCHINMCKVCLGEHVSSQLSIQHDILGYQFKTASSDIVLPTCQFHNNQKCELNCQDCHIPVCSKCIAGIHQKHSIVEIAEIYQSKFQTLEQDTKELENIILPCYERINTEYDDKISKALQGYDKMKEGIRYQGKVWHDAVDIAIGKHLSVAEQMEKKDLAILTKHQSEIQEIHQSVSQTVQTNKSCIKSNCADRVINYKSRNHEFKKFPSTIHLSTPTFIPHENPEERIEKMFGKIQESMKTEKRASAITNERKKPSLTLQTNKRILQNPEIQKDIVSGLDRVYRVCCLPNTEEFYIKGISSTIQHLDNKGKILNNILIKSAVKSEVDLAVNRNGRLVYSDRDDRSINIMKHGKTDTIVRFQGWKPSAVCMTSTNDLLVSMRSDDGENSKVVRYVGSHNTQEIEFDDHGNPLFTSQKFITHNKNQDICVINWGPHELVVVDQAGKLKFKYDGSQILKYKYGKKAFFPHGLDTDSQCHILVADYNNNCVHILHHNGLIITYIELQLYNPLDLSISSDDILYVAGNKGKIQVIKYMK